MAATEEQLARARAQITHREYRVFIGGRRGYVNRSLFVQGEPVTFPANTALTAVVTVSTAVINVVSTTGYESTGMVVLAYGSASEGWFTYAGKSATTFTGCRFLHGKPNHPIGTQVGAWAEITARVTSVKPYDFSNRTTWDWRIELEGVHYNSNLMLPDATVVVLERVTPLGGTVGLWTMWNVIALGYARDWVPTSDKDRERAWKTTVESVSTYVRAHRVSARRSGKVNVAQGGTVTASTALGDVYSESDEWQGGIGSTDAANVVDGNNDTLYISNVAPTRASESAGANSTQGGIYIDEVMAFPTSYMGDDVQWFVVRISDDHPDYATGVAIHDIGIGNKLIDYLDDDPDLNGFAGATPYIRLPEVTLNEDNPCIVLCRNKVRFLQHYAVADGVEVYDWRFLTGFGNDGFKGATFTLDPAGDLLQLRLFAADVSFEVRDMVAWGAVDPNGYWIDDDDEDQWDNSTVTVPADGSSIRRYPTQTDSNTTADWAEETEPVPGLSRVNNNPVYISIRFPEFSINLTENITNTSPANGDYLFISDTAELDASGVIKIDGEEFHYDAVREGAVLLNPADGRGYNSTTPAAHTTSALIYQVDDDLGATRYRKVDHVIVRRWMRLYDGGNQTIPIVPKHIEIWISQEENPAYSGGGYRLDWINGGPVVTATNQMIRIRWKHPLPTPLRVRHGMIRILEMSDGGKAKANEIEWIRYGLSGGVAEGHIGGILADMLGEVIDADDIVVSRDSFPGTAVDLAIPESDLGTVLDNILRDYAGLIAYDKVGGGCTLQRQPLHPLGLRPAIDAELGPASLQSGFPFSRVSRLRVNQIIVEWEDLETGDKYEGRYPPQAGAGGAIERVAVKQAGGSPAYAAMYAEMLYKADERISGRGWFRTAGVGDWLTVGQRLWVFLYDDDAHDAGQYENVIVTGVEHNNDDGGETVHIQQWRMA